MSSLIASASPWNNDTNDNCTRKRISTIRKTVKIRPYAGDILSQSDVSETIEPMSNIEDTQMNNEIHSNKVIDIINQMENVKTDNDGSSLADFKPPPMPLQHVKKDDTDMKSESTIPVFSNTQTIPSDYNNYHNAYTPTIINTQPYYSKMNSLGNNLEAPISGFYDNRISEKINYMIHLLEGQETERTANVTEEFILYTFLGVFIIYICDSFSRGGRYVR